MDKVNIKVNDLQVGMYVELPKSWFAHDFLTNNFKIASKSELTRVKKLKLKEVMVDYSKSDVRPPEADMTKQLPQSRVKPVSDPKFAQPPKMVDRPVDDR